MVASAPDDLTQSPVARRLKRGQVLQYDIRKAVLQCKT
jgi:hypothetical protein